MHERIPHASALARASYEGVQAEADIPFQVIYTSVSEKMLRDVPMLFSVELI